MTDFEAQAIISAIAGMDMEERKLAFIELMKDEKLIELLEKEFSFKITINRK